LSALATAATYVTILEDTALFQKVPGEALDHLGKDINELKDNLPLIFDGPAEAITLMKNLFNISAPEIVKWSKMKHRVLVGALESYRDELLNCIGKDKESLHKLVHEFKNDLSKPFAEKVKKLFDVASSSLRCAKEKLQGWDMHTERIQAFYDEVQVELDCASWQSLLWGLETLLARKHLKLPEGLDTRKRIRELYNTAVAPKLADAKKHIHEATFKKIEEAMTYKEEEPKPKAAKPAAKPAAKGKAASPITPAKRKRNHEDD